MQTSPRGYIRTRDIRPNVQIIGLFIFIFQMKTFFKWLRPDLHVNLYKDHS